MDLQEAANLTTRLIDEERLDEARAVLRQFQPQLLPAMYLYNNGIIEHRAGNHAGAVQFFEQAIAQRPEDPLLHWGLALATLTLGDLQRGWEEFEWRLKLPGRSLARDFVQPQWTGKQDLGGKRILLHGEGGLGDSAQFARYIPMVKELGPEALLLECQPAMMPLFRQIPAVTRTFSRGQMLPPFDYHCPLPSLPRAFGTTMQNIPARVPYLSAPPDRVEVWHKRLGPRTNFRVGIAWCGSAAAWPKRSRTVSIFAPFAELSGIEFHSLQVGREAREARPPGLNVIDHSQQLFDMGETAALCSEMDLIISVDSSVAHLAGALARPVWVLVPRDACFRYLLNRSDSPWYPTMRLFRQATPASDWSQVVKDLANALRELVPQPPMDFQDAINRIGPLINEDLLDESQAKLLELQPRLGHATFLQIRGIIAQRAGEYSDALHSFEQALGLCPDDPRLHWSVALVALKLGDLERGWREFEWRLKLPRSPLVRDFSQPQWTGVQDLHGTIILLHAEGGLGDAAQFVRYVPLVKARGAAALFLECQREMVPLFRRISGVTRAFSRGETLPPFDCHCSLNSLPFALGTRLETIPNEVPYLSAPLQTVKSWQQRLGPRRNFRVGLAWCGSPTAWPRRSRTLGIFAPFAQLSGIEFHSLQVGPEALEPRPPGLKVIDHSQLLTDMGETAALASEMDLIISVDSSVAHLAGALARPVWVLVPRDGCFRYLLDRTDSPWYPTMRLFRQTSHPTDWRQVIEEITICVAQASSL